MSFSETYRKSIEYLEQPISVAPLVIFRIVFGLVMLFSTIRYMAMGWVETQLINPILHFKYFGFEWVSILPGDWIYVVFVLLILSSLGITLGLWYRFSAGLFFLSFTYIELIDITYYLNHYYFVSIVSFLLIFVPANQYFSLDTYFEEQQTRPSVRRWCILIFQVQIAIVYVYAGLAKINYDWLFNALPLSIWLPAKTGIPIIGFLFSYDITPYLFSWAGMLFDTFIIFFIIWKRTRLWAYLIVVFFHLMTGILFQIGVFPLVMISLVTIFFSSRFHEKIIISLSVWLKSLFGTKRKIQATHTPSKTSAGTFPFLLLFFLFQILFPWRYLLYPGNIFWTEEGYRFSWRVMLMEKAGTATFFVKDGAEGREGSVINSQFLNDHQEKQMAMQPDLIVQFAHFLDDFYTKKGMKSPEVRAEVWVTLNSHPAKLLIDPNLDLTTVSDGWSKKEWILPYEVK